MKSSEIQSFFIFKVFFSRKHSSQCAAPKTHEKCGHSVHQAHIPFAFYRKGDRNQKKVIKDSYQDSPEIFVLSYDFACHKASKQTGQDIHRHNPGGYRLFPQVKLKQKKRQKQQENSCYCIRKKQ